MGSGNPGKSWNFFWTFSKTRKRLQVLERFKVKFEVLEKSIKVLGKSSKFSTENEYIPGK